MVKKAFALGILSGILLVGCAGMGIKYYGMAGVVYDHGMLLAPRASDDIPFSSCSPSASLRQPCIVMMSQDFFALKQDYLDTQQKLSDCQRAQGVLKDGQAN